MFGNAPGVEPSYNILVPPGSFLDGNVMLMVPLLTGGLLQRAVRVASAGEKAAASDTEEVRGQVGAGIIDSYLSVLKNDELVKADTAKLTSVEELQRITSAQVQTGDAIPANLQRVQAEVARAQRNLATHTAQSRKSEIELLRAIGSDVVAPLKLTDQLKEQAMPSAIDPYLQSANHNRGAVVAAGFRRLAAEQDLRRVQARYAPQLYLGGSADLANKPGMSGGSAALILSVPLFDGGERRAEVQKAQAALERARADEQAARLMAEAETREAWLDLTAARANVLSAKASVASSEEAYSVMHLRVANGKSILVEELDALQSLTSDRADLAEALYEEEIALVHLNKAAGLDLLAGVQ